MLQKHGEGGNLTFPLSSGEGQTEVVIFKHYLRGTFKYKEVLKKC